MVVWAEADYCCISCGKKKTTEASKKKDKVRDSARLPFLYLFSALGEDDFAFANFV
jgi:hypothetical protein